MALGTFQDTNQACCSQALPLSSRNYIKEEQEVLDIPKVLHNYWLIQEGWELSEHLDNRAARPQASHLVGNHLERQPAPEPQMPSYHHGI